MGVTLAASEVDKLVGARIRLRRLELQLSQAQLADAIGVTYQQIQKYEGGLNRVSIYSLIKICRALDAPVTFFVPDIAGVGEASTALWQKADAAALLVSFAKIGSAREREVVLSLVSKFADSEEPPK